MIRFVRAAVDVLRLAIAREQLGEPPSSAPSPSSPRAPGVLHVLFVSREPLGTDPEPPPRPRRSLLRAVFAREPLPFDPEPASVPRVRRAPDLLPLDPVPPAPPRRSRLAALLAPEKLDDESP